MANPGLNALILGVEAIGIVLSLRQVLRLYPEIAWVNNFRLADPGLAVDRPPVLLAPMAAILGSRVGRMAMSSQLMRGILDFDRHAPRRGTRYFPLHDRVARFPRPARHVLGSDRNRELGRRRHSGPQGERRCRLHVRLPARWPRRTALGDGHFVLVLAVRARRLAGARIPRPAIEPGAEPLLYGTRGLAIHHRLRSGGRADARCRRYRRGAFGDRALARSSRPG